MSKTKIVALSVLLGMLPLQTEAQFFKKLFKKKAKAETVAEVKDSGKDDIQTVMLNTDSLADNSNNRNGFLGIPLGINAERFEAQLKAKGFEALQQADKQTAKTYRYNGEVMGSMATVSLAVSEKTGTVYAVDVEEPAVYNTDADVRKRFAQLKADLVGIYGKGYVDNGGEGYNIVTKLGGVNIHFERITIGGGYMIGFTVDDAKAYATAYEEMADKEYEAKPRNIALGLAQIDMHTDIVGLGTRIMSGKTLTKARNVLKEYEYATKKITKSDLRAGLTLPGGYKADVTVRRRGQTVTGVTITANEDESLLMQAVKIGGYVSVGKDDYKNGRIKISLAKDKQGNHVLKFAATLR